MSVKKRSISIGGHATSISIEDAFWDSFKQIAEQLGQSVPTLIHEIDEARFDDLEEETEAPNLSSAIRLYVLNHYKNELNKKKEA
tara:strand:+ start:1031 stop:1285 length:255 start_codon:yes stop_codon:yes gene_type:complete